MRIELYYFEGCASYQEAIENLRSVLKERNINDEINIIRVESIEHAQEINFQGSPSIVIDGMDLEGIDDPAIFGCRIYDINGKLTGTPTRQFMRDRMDELTKRNST